MNTSWETVPSSMAHFYPNECFICYQKSSREVRLSRCSQCHMISYCGSYHQKAHWKLHKDLCKAISAVAKERNLNHLFEELRGKNLNEWIVGRATMLDRVENIVRRDLLPYERQMFLYPRACFVCHESRQNMLTDCPNCPGATFCKEHKSSSLHDSYCSQIEECHQMDRVSNCAKELKTVEKDTEMALKFIDYTPINNGKTNFKLPTSMEEYLNEFIKAEVKIPSDFKIHASEYLSKALTTYSALQKINYAPTYELTIYVGGLYQLIDLPKFWEILFHLLPEEVKLLRIVAMDQEKSRIQSAKLCDDCSANNKFLLIENVDYSYPKMLDYKTKPNLVVYFNIDPPKEGSWNAPRKMWQEISCPLVVATVNEKNGKIVSETLRETFGDSRIFLHDGENEFKSLRVRREWKDESVFMQNQHMVLCKSKQQINGRDEVIPESDFAKWLRNNPN